MSKYQFDNAKKNMHKMPYETLEQEELKHMAFRAFSDVIYFLEGNQDIPIVERIQQMGDIADALILEFL